MIDYELRNARIDAHLESMDQPDETNFDDEPKRYLAVELDDDDNVLWAYNDDSVVELAKNVEDSSTHRSRFECFDLDTNKEFDMNLHVTSVVIEGVTTNLWLKA